MAWLPLSWFWENDPAPATGTAAIDVTADFVVLAAGTVGATATAAIDITGDFTVAAAGSVGAPTTFTPPGVDDYSRVAVIKHTSY